MSQLESDLLVLCATMYNAYATSAIHILPIPRQAIINGRKACVRACVRPSRALPASTISVHAETLAVMTTKCNYIFETRSPGSSAPYYTRCNHPGRNGSRSIGTVVNATCQGFLCCAFNDTIIDTFSTGRPALGIHRAQSL